MTNPFQLADVLGQYVAKLAYTPGQLARLSGLPQATIVNWLEGRVKKPRRWQGLAKLAAVLHLNRFEISDLLEAAGHGGIDALIERIQDEHGRVLLAPWIKPISEMQNAPFQAIADLPYFVGRENELQQLRQVVLGCDPAPLCLLEGMGGIGKTSLAVHLAYLLRPHFPDGVLWVRVDRTDTMSALSSLALAYGHDVGSATDIESRSQRVRDILGRKRALLILDNVEASTQIRPLLPPTGRCRVLITTRHRNLSILRGAFRLMVGPFDPEKEDALSLFSQHLGQTHVHLVKSSLNAIVNLLGHHPLAIDIVASRLAYEPSWRAADFQDRLLDIEKRLNELTYEEQSVRASIALSYEGLPAELQNVFVGLSIFGGEDFSVEAVSFLLNLTIDDAHDRLRQLYSYSMVHLSQIDRYRLHPLLRDFGREKLSEPADWRQRMVAFFIQYIERHQTDYERLDIEFDNILSALEAAVADKMTRLLVRGIKAFFHYLHVRGQYNLAQHFLAQAHQAAQQTELTDEIPHLLLNQGKIARSVGEFVEAERLLSRGLTMARGASDPEICGALLTELGTVKGILGKFEEANHLFRDSLQLARSMGDSPHMLILLTALGIGSLKRGQYEQAKAYLHEGLGLARHINHRERAGAFLLNLGVCAHEQGWLADAERYYHEALEIHRQINHPAGVCMALSNLSRITVATEDFETAVLYLEEGLILARELGNPETIHTLLRRFGIAEGKRGHHEQATRYFEESLAMTVDLGQDHLSALLLRDLAELFWAQRRWAEADDYFHQALGMARQQENPLFLCDLLLAWGDYCIDRDNSEGAHQALLEIEQVSKTATAEAAMQFESEVRLRLANLPAYRSSPEIQSP